MNIAADIANMTWDERLVALVIGTFIAILFIFLTIVHLSDLKKAREKKIEQQRQAKAQIKKEEEERLRQRAREQARERIRDADRKKKRKLAIEKARVSHTFLMDLYDEFGSCKKYVPRHAVERLARLVPDLLLIDFELLKQEKDFCDKSTEQLQGAIHFINNYEKEIAKNNLTFIERTKENRKAFFESVHAHDLTNNQKEAVITDETNTLVVAGAGTGKTATAVSKIVYLLDSGIVNAEEVLILAYNKKAAVEFEERLSEKGVSIQPKPQVEDSTQSGVTAKTFHALGKDIIGVVEGKSPSISRLAENAQALTKYIDHFLIKRLASQDTAVIRLLTDLLEESEELTNAQTGDEYCKASKDLGLRSICNCYLKSREELCIANYLTLKGIRWEYERTYEFDTSTSRKRQYRPDFYLNDYNIYLEHFGVDKDGNTRPGIDPVRYGAEMSWKRSLHERNGTTLIETNSEMRISGAGLPANLDRLFSEHGIQARNLTVSELNRLKENHKIRFDELTKVLSSFLNLYKTNNYGHNGKKPEATNKRDEVFLELFCDLLNEYESSLEKEEAIDFHDLINLATKYVKERKFCSNFKYIIVDEFQDASLSRLDLVKALREHQWDSRVFAVGDDWQSIYRFAGADVSVMTSFAKYMGECKEIHLDRTFRFNLQLAKLSSHFIQKNPSQLKKRIKSANIADGKILSITAIEKEDTAEKGGYLHEAITRIVSEILSKDHSRSPTIKVLGRYNNLKPAWLGEMNRVNLEFQSVHRSKGLEADYVIVIGVNGGVHGFPSQISDDASLSMVLADHEQFENSEERRLFYVALTRAKKKVYLIHDESNRSNFISEMVEDSWYEDNIHIQDSSVGLKLYCSSCQADTIKRKDGRFGIFYGCSNYPLCTNKLNICARCNEGAITQLEHKRVCSKCECEYENCESNSCDGYYKLTHGRHGPFYSCSNYPECKKTRNVPQSVLDDIADKSSDDQNPPFTKGVKLSSETIIDPHEALSLTPNEARILLEPSKIDIDWYHEQHWYHEQSSEVESEELYARSHQTLE